MSKAIFITGATGKQGGAVVRSLLGHPSFSPKNYTLYALTRDPNSPSAKRLAAKSSSVKLVQGNLNDAKGAFKNMPTSPWGVYIVTMPGKGNKEELEGTAFVDEAVKAGAKHIVFSSVERAGFNPTNVPHFITKHNIEKHLIEQANSSNGKFSYTILRPVFFLDNLEWGFVGKVIATAWRDYVKRPLQVVDTEDIGRLGANAFLASSTPEYENKAISVAGDELTFEDADKAFEQETGQHIPTTFSFIASMAMWMSHDISAMFKFFNDPGYTAEIGHVKTLIGKETRLADWIARSKFSRKKSE